MDGKLLSMVLAIGVPPGYIVAFAVASYGYYILPTCPSDLAAIQFDRSGTTHIGKYVINHSFILPGLIGVGTSCLMAYLLAGLTGLIGGSCGAWVGRRPRWHGNPLN